MAKRKEGRHTRQADIVPADKLHQHRITIVGVGAIGRQVALQLASMGVQDIQIIDFDSVEEVNLGAQGFLTEDLGKPKVQAVKELIEKIDPSIKVEDINARYRRRAEIGDVLFCCVDDMDVRSLIWEDTKDRVNFWADGRMAAENMRVMCAYNQATKDYYETTLFSQAEALEATCTAKTTIYTSNIIAGLLIANYTGWLREHNPRPDFMYHTLVGQMVDMTEDAEKT